jgi:hypothetical protein
MDYKFLAVWSGILIFCLAFWAGVAYLVMEAI